MSDSSNSLTKRKLFESIEYYERLRKEATTVNRIGNFDVVKVDDEDIGICHVVVMLPLGESKYFFEDGYAVGLAADHLNKGDGSVIAEIDGLDKTCNIKFTFEMIDTMWSDSVAVEKLLQILDRETGGDDVLPCAFIGTATSSVTLPTSILTGIKGYPQMTPLASSTSLDDKNQYKLLSRLFPSDEGPAYSAIMFLANRLNVYNLAVVHDNDTYGNAYARALQNAARSISTSFKLEFIDMPVQKSPKDFENAVSFLKSTQYRYFFVVFSNSYKDFEPLMSEAYKQKIAGTGEYAWIFSDGGVPVEGKKYDVGSPLHKSILGSLQLSVVGDIAGTSYDSLAKSWKDLDQNEELKNFVASKHPSDTNVSLEDNIFDSVGWAVPFIYDTMIDLGISACQKDNDTTFLDGESHFKAILNTEFNGTTGRVILNNVTGTRDPTSSTFTMSNFVERFLGNGKVSFVDIETEILQDGHWKNINTRTIFNDNTTVPPLPLPAIEVDYNYIGTSLRSVAFSLYGLIFLANIFIIIWTNYYRKKPIVRKSQPIFLNFVAFGVLLMTAAVVPMSLDDDIASEKQCSISCMLVPWFLAPGFGLVFSALFSKTWRINRLLLNTTIVKLKVSPKDVMAPLVAVLGANILILILWTTLSPLEWVRSEQSTDIFGRVTSSYGRCTSEYTKVFLPLLALPNFAILIFAAFQAYLARHFTTELSESHYIMLSLSSILFISLLAIPVLILTSTSNPKASYLSQIILDLMIGAAVLILIFGPKIRKFYEKKNVNLRASNVPEKFLKKSNKLFIRMGSVKKHQTGDGVTAGNSSESKYSSEVASNHVSGVRIVDVRQNQADWEQEKHLLQDRIKHLEMRLEILESIDEDTKLKLYGSDGDSKEDS